MKKILAIIFTLLFAYITSYYTTDASKDQEPFEFDNNQLFYKMMCLITGETDTTDANALLKEAEYFYEYEAYDLALENYNSALKLDSANNFPVLRIADCYMAMNDTSKAVSILENQLARNKKDEVILSTLGEIYLWQEDFNKAEKFLVEAAELYDYTPNIRFNLSQVYIGKKEYKKALEYITKAINGSEENTEYINIRRKLYLQLNQPDLAKVDYERILYIDPYFFPDYAEKANTAKESGNFQSAIEYYKRALKFDPTNKELLINRGWIYNELQEYDSAYSDYDILVKLYPDYYNYFNRAYALDGLGRIEESIKDYTVSISYKDDYYISYNNRGYEYYQLKKYELAEKDYTKSIEIKEDYYLSYLNRGLTYYHRERYEEAVADFKLAMQYSANNTTIIYNLALAYDQLDKQTQAIDYFNEYLRIKENIDSTTYNYIIKRIANLSNQ